jgi:hypothetical protein
MIRPDGSLDDLHAMVFPLGAFDDEAKASEHAKNIISITGHPGVIAARYGTPVHLTSKFDPNIVTEVAIDPKGRLIELESAQYRHERAEYERRAKQERDIMKEAEDETDPDSIEHFKRQCFVAIKNRSAFQLHSKEAETAWENYKKRETAVREHFARHPEHEKEWLPYLKEKLTERGELNLYLGIEAAYKEIRDEILGLRDDDSGDQDTCDGGVCFPTAKPTEDVAPTDICSGGVSFPSDKSKEEVSPINICVGDACFPSVKSKDEVPVPDQSLKQPSIEPIGADKIGDKCVVSQDQSPGDDDMIDSEDVPEHKESSLPTNDQGFIDESDDD